MNKSTNGLISIHNAAKLLSAEVSCIEVPSLASIPGLEDSGFDADDDRWFYQTMAHRNAIVDAIKSGKIRAVSDCSMVPIVYQKNMLETQLIRFDDFLAFADDLGFVIRENL